MVDASILCERVHEVWLLVLQMLELAHIVSARRLQEAGRLADDLAAPSTAQRTARIMAEVARSIKEHDGDARAAADSAERSGVGRYLDEMPSAEAAINYHMSKSTSVHE
jgi:hypothetical protein